jgi:hypothetical protein
MPVRDTGEALELRGVEPAEEVRRRDHVGSCRAVGCHEGLSELVREHVSDDFAPALRMMRGSRSLTDQGL